MNNVKIRFFSMILLLLCSNIIFSQVQSIDSLNIIIYQGGTGTDSIVTRNQSNGRLRVRSLASVFADIKVSNGLVKQLDTIQLGGILTKATTITTNATNTLAIAGLQSGAATDSILVVNPTTNVIRRISPKSPILGDVKTGLQSADHSGWVILNGRLKSTLTSNQQSNATALGIGTNIPDATGAVLMKNTFTIGAVNGSNSRLITRSNLPVVKLSGTALAGGAHSHGYKDRGIGGYGANISSGSNVVEDDGENNRTTDQSTTHSHTVEVDLNTGTQDSLDITPKSLSVNVFIYLGN